MKPSLVGSKQSICRALLYVFKSYLRARRRKKEKTGLALIKVEGWRK